MHVRPRLSLAAVALDSGFYCRATRMHSANYIVARCMFVRPSVTRRYSVETAKYIINVFTPSDSQTILSFPHQTGWQYYDGTPPNGDIECKGYEKNHYFWPISSLNSEVMQDKAIVNYGRRIASKPHPSFRIVPVWMTWVTSNPDFKVTVVTILFNVKYGNPKTVQDRAIFIMADQ